MLDRATKLRWRRRLRRGRHRAVDFTEVADEHLEKHFIKRLSKLNIVRRFVFSWVALLVLLITALILQTRHLQNYYLGPKPAPGGIFSEGILGTFSNANPIYASGTVDSSVSRLIFSGLLKYNQENNQLIGDLAEKWEIDSRETTYTVTLKPGLKWHDGQPLTAADVVFTFNMIANADAKSPLFSSWQGIAVEAKDDLTITFKLPNAFSAFPHSLTTGILPAHLLQKVPPAQLRSVAFNTSSPVGSGPFKWQAIEVNEALNLNQRQQSIGLQPYDDYHFGKPKLSKFVIRTYQDERDLINAMAKGEITACVGLATIPEELKGNDDNTEHSIPITGSVFAFFKNTNPLLAESGLRRALVLAANPAEVATSLSYPVITADSPLLKRHLGYNPSIIQVANNVEEAKKQLDSLGWVLDTNTGLRVRGDKKLTLRLYSENTSEYTAVAQILQKQWRAVGVEVEVILLPDEDLQSIISIHEYDILLYGISTGIDPDVYAFWHSTQADPRATNRLNFSEYKSSQADLALEAGRTRSDPAIREVKYKPFLEAWRADNPALALYQPRFLYLSHNPLHNFSPTTMNQSADRFTNVHNWMIREEKSPL